MNKNEYTMVGKFNCCGNVMVTVIIKDKAACVMTEMEYNKIIEVENRIRKKSKRRAT